MSIITHYNNILTVKKQYFNSQNLETVTVIKCFLQCSYIVIDSNLKGIKINSVKTDVRFLIT